MKKKSILLILIALGVLLIGAPNNGAAQTGPTLTIPVVGPVDAGTTVTVPVTYTANGNAISSMVFSVDLDETNLDFDPAATLGFPWPDAISVNPLINPFVFSVGITYDPTDTDGELDFNFADISPPLSALPEGDLVTITFTVKNPPASTNAPVVFSTDPTASFGNTLGQSVPGVTVDGSVSINVPCIPTGTMETVCNGIDDDCDSLIDEDFTPSTATCGLGECAATGQTTCIDGVLGDTCVPGSPTAEVCDNLDNDCNGLIDDNLTRASTCGLGECAGNTGVETCSAGTWGGDTCDPLAGAVPEVCDGLDNDCDGTVDNGLTCNCNDGDTRACGSDAGECVAGTESCVSGDWSGICVGEVGPSAEVCDNLDNDCDGATDENLTRSTTCGVGECGATGEETCTAGTWGGDTCTPGAPSAEICDNLDNDCDGSIDENLTRSTTCGVGECGSTGTETCSAGAWGNDTCTPGTPSAEVCDNLDNDCDGSIDENLTRPTTCGVGECGATGEETCTAGAWGNDTCTPGSPSAEVCDNLDNDCDGSIDENLTRASTCGVGECAGNTGVETCSSGTWGGDTCDPLAGAVPEVCDGLDNDCDGTVDDGLTCNCNDGDTRACGSDAGECVAGTESCVSGDWSGICVGEVGPSAEVCDNLDNDCDGATDENLTRSTTCGVGECGAAGEETCTAGAWGNDTCTPGTPSAEICDNLDNDCDGTIDDNLTRPTTCGVGECGATGEETCTAGTWGGDTCTPGTPSAEICDNLDNDCDGSIDENLTRPTTCGIGECGATGEETCTAGAWGNDTCTPGTPSAEVCDNLDNDCDGSIDENLTRPTTCGVGECGATGEETCTAGAWGNDTCTPGSPSAEVCDNLDNDCDGSIDENLTRASTCGVGECAGNTGVETCSSGTWGGDTCDPLAGAVPEVCDGLDNDCDGTADDGLTCVCNDGDTRACGSDAGECVAGTESCVGGNWSGICVGEVGPSAEVCDGLDNDCDGSIDENLTRSTTCGVGECGAAGEETCTAGAWGNDTCTPGAPSAEVCDNLDNDCDGLTDENLTRPTTCGVGECGATGEETCTAGAWGNDTCTPGAPSSEVCDNLDNDCDGSIDENLTRATTCGIGECGATGEESCTAGVWGNDTCTPGAPSAEVCDNLDNDCDGSIDENLTRATTCGIGECGATGQETCTAGAWGNDTCTPGAPSAEVCDNLDNDCDGSIDENLSRASTCGVGECAGNTGEETCTAGTWGNDTCDPLAGAVPEVCDGLDNDCDGTVDDGLTCVCNDGDTRACGSDVGECAAGTESCVGGAWSGTCVGEVGPSAEVCDNLDNDCDGSTDENLSRATTCGVGECGATGQETCTAGSWSNDTCTPGTPSAEVCDSLDNDCDGATDENLSRPTTCGVGECGATGQETCTAGSWGNDTCTPGTPSAEVCDNLDNDCDGATDENLSRPTTCGVGECGATGQETCTAGAWGNDTCTPGAPSAEICDNLDNDCDGAIDENVTRQSTCGLGACAGNTGEETCTAGTWGGDTCDPLAGATAEVCDNLDNDCNGATDDNLTRPTTCGVGQCAGNTGEETCSAGTWGNDTCDPFAGAMPEGPAGDGTCSDTLDNDCDGQTDNDDSNCDVNAETDCFDDVDNDGDGMKDCADPDCDGVTGVACATGNACTTGTRTCVAGSGGSGTTTLYAMPSSGVNIANGIQTDHGSCSNDPSSAYVEELSTNLNNMCTSNYRYSQSSVGLHSEHYFNTAYASNTTVTGDSYQFTIRDGGTFGIQLFYVTSDGSKTYLGTEVTRSNPDGASNNYTVDLSGQSGMVPAGAKLGLRTRLVSLSGSDARVYLGNPDGRTGNISGKLIVNDSGQGGGGAEVCVEVNKPDGTACGDSWDTQCDNPDSCLAGVCVPNFEPPTTVCDDGQFCIEGETCNGAGVCSGGSSPCQPWETCDEDNNVCIQTGECSTDADCDDGLFCNGEEKCDDGECEPRWGTIPCQYGETCDEDNDLCLPAVECEEDNDCDDGLFCNGAEICAGGQCQSGTDPCLPTDFCNEYDNVCEDGSQVECITDADCDDGLFCTGEERCDSHGQCRSDGNPCNENQEICNEDIDLCEPLDVECVTDLDCQDAHYCNGVETCVDGQCQPGEDPCPSCTVCEESQETCSIVVLLDLDIDKFSVFSSTPYKDKGNRKSPSRSVRVGTPIDRIHLTVSNSNGACDQSAVATVTGIQDGKQVYKKNRQVSDFSGLGARFAFPDYTPLKKGTIEWTAEIFDDDGDRDESRESTRVR